MSQCDCIEKVNALLAPKNTTLVQDMISATAHSFVATAKLKTSVRSKPVSMMAAYCPFCGEKYPARRTIYDKSGEGSLKLEGVSLIKEIRRRCPTDTDVED